MTIVDVLQFYTPIVGMLGMAFWVGMLQQKVADLRQDVAKIIDHGDGDTTTERLVRLEVQMTSALTGIDKLDRNLQGVQRQLGNIAGKSGVLHDLNKD